MTELAEGWASYPAVGTINGEARTAETPGFSASPASPPPAKVPGKRLRLENAAQVRREMTKVYRQMKAGELDVVKGTKLIYTLTELSRIIEREGVERLAERLDAMERGL